MPAGDAGERGAMSLDIGLSDSLLGADDGADAAMHLGDSELSRLTTQQPPRGASALGAGLQQPLQQHGASAQQLPDTHAGAGAPVTQSPRASSLSAARSAQSGGGAGADAGAGASAHTGAGAGAGVAGQHAGGQSLHADAPDVCPELLKRAQKLWPGRGEAFWRAICRQIRASRRPWLVINKVDIELQQILRSFPTHSGLPLSFQPCSCGDAEIVDIVNWILVHLFQFQVLLSPHAHMHAGGGISCRLDCVLTLACAIGSMGLMSVLTRASAW